MISIELKGDIEPITIDTDKPLKEIADLIAEDITKNLKESTGIDGASLTQLSEAYRRWKQKKFGHDNIFWAEGKLRQSINVSKEAEGFVVYIADAERQDIGYWINEGTAKMPQRKFFGLSNRVRKSIQGILKTVKWLPKS